MKRPFYSKLISGLLNVLVCLTVATLILISQDWFGKGDLHAFVFWTIPPAASLSVCGVSIIRLIGFKSLFFRILTNIGLAVLISFAWFYCVYFFLGPWINTFSFPIFYIWMFGNTAQLLFLQWRFQHADNEPGISKALIKLLWFPATLGISVVVLFGISLLGSELTKPPKELYLIPAGFSGNFRVVYGEKCGLNPLMENGRRVMQIPPNGLLIIRPKFQGGQIDNEYYFVDANGHRSKINELYNYRDPSSKSPGILLTGSGNIPGAMPDGSYSSESPLTINFTDFAVWAKDSATRTSSENPISDNKILDSSTGPLVNACSLNAVRNKN